MQTLFCKFQAQLTLWFCGRSILFALILINFVLKTFIGKIQKPTRFWPYVLSPYKTLWWASIIHQEIIQKGKHKYKHTHALSHPSHTHTYAHIFVNLTPSGGHSRWCYLSPFKTIRCVHSIKNRRKVVSINGKGNHPRNEMIWYRRRPTPTKTKPNQKEMQSHRSEKFVCRLLF